MVFLIPTFELFVGVWLLVFTLGVRLQPGRYVFTAIKFDGLFIGLGRGARCNILIENFPRLILIEVYMY